MNSTGEQTQTEIQDAQHEDHEDRMSGDSANSFEAASAYLSDLSQTNETSGVGASWTDRLGDMLWPSIDMRIQRIEARLSALDHTITRYPEASAAYVLRGEIYLDAQFYGLAIEDFTRALALAEQQYKTSDWGVVAQAMRDRARVGLQKAQAHRPKR